MTIKAVVFDFGGVLISPITNQIGEVAASHGVDAAVMKELLLGPRASGDHPWHRAERGELAVADVQARLGPWADLADVTLHGDEIDRLLAAGQYSIIAEMIDRVGSLRRDGYLTGLLTNTFEEFRLVMQRDIDFSMFDAVIESFAVGSRKPEGTIYSAMSDAIGVAGDEIVYLDDFGQNLDTANELGWNTIHVADPRDALDELDRLLARSDDPESDRAINN